MIIGIKFSVEETKEGKIAFMWLCPLIFIYPSNISYGNLFIEVYVYNLLLYMIFFFVLPDFKDYDIL